MKTGKENIRLNIIMLDKSQNLRLICEQMANLNAFVNRLAGGGARANQFEVTLVGVGVLTEPFSFLCRTAQIPGLTIGVVTVPYRGRQVFVAGDRT